MTKTDRSDDDKVKGKGNGNDEGNGNDAGEGEDQEKTKTKTKIGGAPIGVYADGGLEKTQKYYVDLLGKNS